MEYFNSNTKRSLMATAIGGLLSFTTNNGPVTEDSLATFAS